MPPRLFDWSRRAVQHICSLYYACAITHSTWLRRQRLLASSKCRCVARPARQVYSLYSTRGAAARSARLRWLLAGVWRAERAKLWAKLRDLLPEYALQQVPPR